MGCASSKDLDGGFRPRPNYQQPQYQQYQQQPQYQQQYQQQPQYQQQQPQYQQQQQSPYGLPQHVIPPSTLPPGWISQYDSVKQRLFYIYPQTNTVTWIHPNGPEADAQEMARFYQIQELQRDQYTQVPQGNNNYGGGGINKSFADSYNRHGGMGPGASLLAGGAVGLLAGGLLAEGLEHHTFGGGFGNGDGFGGGGFGGPDYMPATDVVENNTVIVENNNTYIDNDTTYNNNDTTYNNNDNTYNNNDTYNDYGQDNDYSGADFGDNDYGGDDY